MTISHSDNYIPYHARNIEDITIAGCSGNLTVVASVGGDSRQLTLSPLNGVVVLSASDLLKGFDIGEALNLSTVLSSDDPRVLPLPTFLVKAVETSTSVTYSRRIMDGGIDGDDDVRFLTWRKPVTETFKGAREFLGFVCPPDAEECTVHIRVYFRLSGTEHRDISVSPSGKLSLVAVPVSYDTVRSMLDDTADDVVAYDVWATVGGIELPARRYFVRSWPSGARCFVFRNTLGFYDTVYATGKITTMLEGEARSFKCKDVERELSNDAAGHIAASSGYITTGRERVLWEDFLSSCERYELRDGELKRIIVTEYEFKPVINALASVDFTYHLGEKPVGRYYNDQPIEPFDYDLSEF